MKKIIVTVALFALGFFTKINAQTEAEMKAWMAYMTPGEVHKWMAKGVGKWSLNVTAWMTPGAQPAKSTGTSVTEMILGGRYQQSKTTGQMMGQPFEGLGLVAYDNSKKVYISTWIDNMGTGMMTLEGTMDDATKTITLKGNCIDPSTGKDMVIRQTVKFIDDDHQKFEMFTTANGAAEYKNLEIDYTRVK